MEKQNPKRTRLQRNIGKIDRIFRAGLGVLLLLAAIYWHSWLLLAAALFCLFEAAISWCPLYQLLGKNTCPRK